MRTMHRPPDELDNEVAEAPLAPPPARRRKAAVIAAAVAAVIALAAVGLTLADPTDSTSVRQGGSAAPAAESEPEPTPTTAAPAPAPSPSGLEQPAAAAGPSCPAAAPQPPAARAGMAMAADASGLLIVGGHDGAGNRFSDTVGYACGAWRAPVAAGSPQPPAGPNAAAAYDAARNTIVLVAADQSTWTWKDGTWAPRPGAAKPAKMSEPRMAYDSVRQRVLLLGPAMRAGGGLELWSWDGTTWTQAPGQVPTDRLAGGFAFDAARGKAVLFGGQASFDPSTKSNETWTYDGSRWTKETPAQSPPAGMAHAGYDPVRKEVVALTRDGTWAWNGATWAKRAADEAGPRFRGATNLVWDPALQRVVLFGGKTFDSVAGDLWAFDGTAWSKLA